MEYAFLAIAIVSEVIATSYLKQTEGFTKLTPSLICAAASVLAKTHRDEYMRRLAEEFPQYGWAKNKGYPTREHRLAIREHGLTPHHRLTFNHEIDQLELPF